MSHNEEMLAQIAYDVLNINTLETKNSDSKDFHELSVWDVKEALEKVLIAYKKLPNDPVVLEHLGDIYFALKKIDKALYFWKESIKKRSKDSKRIRRKIELHMKRKK